MHIKKYAKDNCLKLEGKRVGKDSEEGLLLKGKKMSSEKMTITA